METGGLRGRSVWIGPWPGPDPVRRVEEIVPSALPEPRLPFDRYLEELNRIAARVESEARLPRFARPAGLGGRIDVFA